MQSSNGTLHEFTDILTENTDTYLEIRLNRKIAPISHEDAHKFSTALRNNTSVECLEIISRRFAGIYEIEKIILSILSRALKNNTTIKTLLFSLHSWGKQFNKLMKAISENHTLEKLHITNMAFDTGMYEALTNALIANGNIKNLKLINTNRHHVNFTFVYDIMLILESLTMGDEHNLSHHDVKHFAMGIKNSKTLKKVKLEEYEFLPYVSEIFFKVIAENETLVKLVLNDINGVYDLLLDSLVSNKSLVSVTKTGWMSSDDNGNKLVDVILKNDTLMQLHLPVFRLEVELFKKVLIALEDNQTLESLEFCVKEMSENSMKLLVRCLSKNQTLKYLGIEIDNMEINISEYAAQIISVNDSLTSLTLFGDNENINEEPILKALERNQTLTKLNLGRFVKLSDEMKKLLKRNKNNMIRKAETLFDLLLDRL